jgi:hydrogenase/urease accessory protein HupE
MSTTQSRRSLLSALFLAVAAGIVLCAPASAHEIRPAYLQISENTQHGFDVLWKQPSIGTQVLRLAPKVSNGVLDGEPAEEGATNSFLIRRWQNVKVSRASFDGATIHIEGLEYTLTDALVTLSFASGQEIQEILHPRAPTLVVHLTGTGKLPVPAYLILGVEHILTGFDHLSFVLGLLLLVRSRFTLLKTITAFTIAHSLTLAAAALGWVHVKPAVIEALVAFSIVFVAVEVVRAYRGDYGLTARFPWLIAFTFGLLHGFAFAGSLAEIGLPEHNIPMSLLLFNVGVEIGQLLFVGAVLAVIALLRRLPARIPPWTRWIPPYAIGGLASFWVIERLHFLTH